MLSPLHPERLAHAVAERVVALVVGALDIDALVSSIDINALLDQVDVERLLDRIDLDALLARTDLAAIVASAASGTADEALAALRDRAAAADDTVSGWVGRLRGRP